MTTQYLYYSNMIQTFELTDSKPPSLYAPRQAIDLPADLWQEYCDTCQKLKSLNERIRSVAPLVYETANGSYWDEATDPGDIFGLPNVTWEEGLGISLQEIAPAFHGPDNLPVLDLGCGPGRLAVPASQLYNRYIIGIDSSQSMLDLAVSSPRVSYLLNNGINLPPYLPTFGGAYCMLLFQHLEPSVVQNYLSEVAQALVSNAIFQFQFVEGTTHEERSHGYSLDEIIKWCSHVGLAYKTSRISQLHRSWVWVTCSKTMKG